MVQAILDELIKCKNYGMSRLKLNAKIPAFLPLEDGPEETHFELEDDIIAEGQSFIIGYLDSKGKQSSRAITVWSVKYNDAGNLVLIAKCHERNSIRSFRIDRIKYCADSDGEINENVTEFLTETFGSTVSAFSSLYKSNDSLETIKSKFRNEFNFLAAIAVSDGFISNAEVETIVDFAVHQAFRLNVDLCEQSIEKLCSYLKRLRPSIETIDNSLLAISKKTKAEKLKFISACDRVMNADGIQHPKEIILFDQLKRELFGI